jgi:hypothetical protein
MATYLDRVGEETSAEEAPCSPNLQDGGATIVFPTRNLSRPLPEPRCARPIMGSLDGVGGNGECGKRGLQAKDGYSASSLLGDPLQVARSYSLQRFGGVRVSRRLTVRAKAVVGLFTARGIEPDDTALDGDKAFSLCIVEGLQELPGRQAGDLDRKLDVELIAQDRKSPDHPGCRADVRIHLDGE